MRKSTQKMNLNHTTVIDEENINLDYEIDIENDEIEIGTPLGTNIEESLFENLQFRNFIFDNFVANCQPGHGMEPSSIPY